MQCEKFENRMHELLDRREPPESDALLREHALVCGGCANSSPPRNRFLPA